MRLRAGFAADTWLFYVAGGLSLADLKLTLTNPVSGYSQSANNDFVGFNLGVGSEYAMTKNILLRLEYIYDDFGTKNYNFFVAAPNFDSRSVKFSENTVRAAVEYKF